MAETSFAFNKLTRDARINTILKMVKCKRALKHKNLSVMPYPANTIKGRKFLVF